jgi:hypothetical protein
MPKCELCGQEAWFFRKRHKECQEKYESGSQSILDIAQNAILDKRDLGSIDIEIHEIAQSSFLDALSIKSLLVEAWENSVAQALEDNILTKQEEDILGSFCDYFALTQVELDESGAYGTFIKGGVIRELLDGNLPQRVQVDGALPFNFQKSESLIWVFQNVEYYELKTRKHYVGGSSGISVRIAKGVYYRIGSFRGSPVETQESVHVDTGILAVTNKHIYFAGSRKAFKITYNKIVSFTPYSDGIGIQRDASTAGPQSFVTGDGWFTYNLLSNLANMGDG